MIFKDVGFGRHLFLRARPLDDRRQPLVDEEGDDDVEEAFDEGERHVEDEQRVREAARLGFTRAIVPFRNVEKRPIEVEGMKIIPVKSVYEVIKELKSIE